MNNYPQKIEVKNPIDLKLGIKSSMPKIKAPIALLYFLWISNGKPSKLEYSEEILDSKGNQVLKLAQPVEKNLYEYFEKHNLLGAHNRENVDKLLYQNYLFLSQIEALKVTFELVFKLAEFSYRDKELSYSAERQKVNGKSVRYNKVIYYTRDIDVISLFVEQRIEKTNEELFAWLMGGTTVDEDVEISLSKLLTMLSDEAVFRLRINETDDIKFNMAGVYKSLVDNDNQSILVNDFKENMGSLRILGSILKEDLNYFIRKEDNSSKNVVISNKISKDDLENYAKRVETHFDLINIDLSLDTKKISREETHNEDIDQPHQRIFFGAPGTGKSYELNKEAEENFGTKYERVTFHPNYMYGNFIGSFKPFSKRKNEDEEKKITYEYVPGILMRMLVKAFKYPTENFLIVIEEINRANVAAVFGDFFQLLDRDQSGNSEYDISTSEEVREYLKEKLSNITLAEQIQSRLGEGFEKLYLPSNLYIWATMNSADQGVMPMDTAFRRRWDFKYLGINDAVDSSFDNYRIRLSANETTTWDDFRRAVNRILSSKNIPEDKLLGPYFIPKATLEKDTDILTIVVRNKVLMYLFEDAGKAYRNQIFRFAEGDLATFSTVCSKFDTNVKTLFKDALNLEKIVVEDKLNVGEDPSNSVDNELSEGV